MGWETAAWHISVFHLKTKEVIPIMLGDTQSTVYPRAYVQVLEEGVGGCLLKHLTEDTNIYTQRYEVYLRSGRDL